MTLEQYNHFFRVNGQVEIDLWKNAVFVFDTSAILEIYYYPQETRNQVFDNVYSVLEGKLWITSHTSYEYLKNRESVIRKPVSEKYLSIRKEDLKNISEKITFIKNASQNISHKTKKTEQHPYLEQSIFNDLNSSIENLLNEFNKFCSSFDEQIAKIETEFKELESADVICDYIFNNFKITDSYEFDKIYSVIKDSHKRFADKIPPGYEDAIGKSAKEGIQKAGDLIIWNQLIELSLRLKMPIIYISNDVKEDWCVTEKRSNETRVIKPKEDLTFEFMLKTNNQFWLYSSSQFLYKAKEILNVSIDDKSLKEVDQLREQVKPIELPSVSTSNSTSSDYIDLMGLILRLGDRVRSGPHGIGVVTKLSNNGMRGGYGVTVQYADQQVYYNSMATGNLTKLAEGEN